ncbi:MAG TPA: CAP domain-containing protein [Steroidobacteraceae bacterium]|nr:CAP domain-containing protein [Steroidobacteraceae bacterium]
MGHRFLPIILVLSMLAMGTSPAAGATTPLDLARSVRTQGCRGHAGIRTPLRYIGGLNEAALSVAQGAPLKTAVARSGYREQESTSIHISGDASALQQVLSNQLCDTLLNPDFGDVGIAQRGHDTWMIFAVPFTPPPATSAGPVGTELLQRINQARAKARRCGSKLFAAAPALQPNLLLRAAAEAHARDMLEHNYFAHEGHDGSNPAQRVAAEGYGYRLIGENIASGPTTAAEAVAGWLASPEHCENLMDARFTDSGIGFSASTHGLPRIYWVQEFGTPR